MFNKIRRAGYATKDFSFKKVFTFIIFGAICVVFVFMFMPAGGGDLGSNPGNAATVDGEAVTLFEYQQAVDSLRRQNNMDMSQFPPALRKQFTKNLQERAIQGLIERKVINQAFDKEGLKVSKKEIASIIMDIDAFKNDNKVFSKVIYLDRLKQNKYTAKRFENAIRNDIVPTKLQQMFVASQFPLHTEHSLNNQLEKSKAIISFIKFKSSELMNSKVLTDQEAKDFMAKNVDKVKNYYDSHLQDYKTEESVKARHILVKFKSGDKKSEAAALEKINKVNTELKNGASFESLVAKYSEDIGSKAKQGSLGFFKRGQMVPPFEQAAFTLKKNIVSEPVKTSYGYHLIEVLDKKAKEIKLLKDVEFNIAKKLLKESKAKVAVKNLKEEIKTNGSAAVENFVKTHSLKWKDTKEFAFNSSPQELKGQEEVVDTAFNVKAGEIASKVVVLGGENYLVKLKKVSLSDNVAHSEVSPKFEELLKASFTNVQPLFSDWVSSEKTGMEISVNPQIF